MSHFPRVSVVIPLYNKQATIRRAIASILAQAIDDIEIIVVDDGSTDASVAEVAALDDPRLRLISQHNAGPGPARNTGARAATAPLLAFLDADDEWMSGYLAAGVAALDAHPDCLAYVCGYDSGAFARFYRNTIPDITPVARALEPPADAGQISHLLDCLSALHSSSTIVRRDVFNRLGGFYERERCLWGEDSYLWIQVLFGGPIYWDPTQRIHYHLEDSALGFAVKARRVARPLAVLTDELAATIPVERRAAFRRLAQAIAQQDAADIGRSGLLLKAFSLRSRHGLPRAKAAAGDARRFAAHVCSNLLRGDRG